MPNIFNLRQICKLYTRLILRNNPCTVLTSANSLNIGPSDWRNNGLSELWSDPEITFAWSWVWGHFASNLTIAYNITFLKDLNTLATSELILYPYQWNVKTPRVIHTFSMTKAIQTSRTVGHCGIYYPTLISLRFDFWWNFQLCICDWR
jgi:hypothetical protein